MILNKFAEISGLKLNRKKVVYKMRVPAQR